MTILEISSEVRDTVTALTQDLFAAETFVDHARVGVQKGNDVLILLNNLDDAQSKGKANQKLVEFEKHLATMDETQLGLENLQKVFSSVKERCDSKLEALQEEVETRRNQVRNLEKENEELREAMDELRTSNDDYFRKCQTFQESAVKQDLEVNKMAIDLTAAKRERDRLFSQLADEQKQTKSLNKEKRVLVLEVTSLRDLLKIKEQEIESLKEVYTTQTGKMSAEMKEVSEALQSTASAKTSLSMIRSTVQKLNATLENWADDLESCLPENLEPAPNADHPDIEVRLRSNERMDALLGLIMSAEDDLSLTNELQELCRTCVHILKARIAACKIVNTREAEKLKEKHAEESMGLISGAVSGVGSVLTTSVSYVPILGSLLVASPEVDTKEGSAAAREPHLEGIDPNLDTADIRTLSGSEDLEEDDEPSEGEEAPRFWNPVDLPEDLGEEEVSPQMSTDANAVEVTI